MKSKNLSTRKKQRDKSVVSPQAVVEEVLDSLKGEGDVSDDTVTAYAKKYKLDPDELAKAFTDSGAVFVRYDMFMTLPCDWNPSNEIYVKREF